MSDGRLPVCRAPDWGAPLQTARDRTPLRCFGLRPFFIGSGDDRFVPHDDLAPISLWRGNCCPVAFLLRLATFARYRLYFDGIGLEVCSNATAATRLGRIQSSPAETGAF
jgi:hypothetical protein